MTKTMKSLLVLALIFSAVQVYAANPPKPLLPPGIGRYILVLKLPGERYDSPKTITEPDVTSLGGKILDKHDNRRIIDLPTAAAKALRANENVAYLQRVWMGETLDTWDERGATPGGSVLKKRTEDVTGSNLTWNSGSFAYDPSGNIKAIGSDTYTYDTANRLVKAVVGGQTENYGYDSFGNLTQKAVAGQPSTVPAIDSSSNRIAGETYDAAGNEISNGRRIAYVFDSAGSLAELDTSNVTSGLLNPSRRMIYTAEDERIGEMLSPTFVRWKIRDFNTGQILREFSSEGRPNSDTWEWWEDYVYAGSTVAGGEMEEYRGGRRHFHLDHLGSVRMITSEDHLRYSRNDYYPFGTEQSSSVQEATNFGFQRSDPVKFTGQERDFYGFLNVDNMDYIDYMHARFYNPNMGRFLSVDPVMSVDATRSPQLWNRYAYVGNNPMNRVDPTGKILEFSGNTDDLNKVKTIANSGLHGYELNIGKNGVASLSKVKATGKETKEQKAFRESLQRVIGDKGTTAINVASHGQGVVIGSFNLRTIDPTDMSKFGSSQPSAASTLGHEVMEQYAGQVLGMSSYSVAHAWAIQQENTFTGWTRGAQGPAARQPNGMVGVDVFYSRGKQTIDVRVTVDPQTQDVVSVTRTPVP